MLERVHALAIPPAWRSVWICLDPLGHLQATGVDAAGRKQYLYHEQWRARRDREKFDRMLEFAGRLPRLRRSTLALLERDELTRDRVLAGAVRLLDLGFFRIGSESYAEENDTFGLATMRKSHVRLGPGCAPIDAGATIGELIERLGGAGPGQPDIQNRIDAAVRDLLASPPTANGSIRRRARGGGASRR